MVVVVKTLVARYRCAALAMMAFVSIISSRFFPRKWFPKPKPSWFSLSSTEGHNNRYALLLFHGLMSFRTTKRACAVVSYGLYGRSSFPV